LQLLKEYSINIYDASYDQKDMKKLARTLMEKLFSHQERTTCLLKPLGARTYGKNEFCPKKVEVLQGEFKFGQ
jgi:hypothetical protein